MSNLNLPKMTYGTLSAMVRDSRNYQAELAYKTTAEYGDGGHTVVIRHHGNPIAEIGEHFFTLDNAGWHSRTTSDRLNRILQDNCTDPYEAYPERPLYSVRIRQGRMVVTGYWKWDTDPIMGIKAGTERVLREFDRSVAHFSRVDAAHHYVLEGGDEYR